MLVRAINSRFFVVYSIYLPVLNYFQTNWRYENDELKRAGDASRDAKFSAILAIVFGIAIAGFCIFIFAIVPKMA